jgi:hypothetical protein
MAAKESLVSTAKTPDAKEAFIKEASKKKKTEVETKMLNTRVPKGLIKKLKIYCVEHETTVQEFITQIIEEKLK